MCLCYSIAELKMETVENWFFELKLKTLTKQIYIFLVKTNKLANIMQLLKTKQSF